MVTETTWPARTKIFTIRPFKEKKKNADPELEDKVEEVFHKVEQKMKDVSVSILRF